MAKERVDLLLMRDLQKQAFVRIKVFGAKLGNEKQISFGDVYLRDTYSESDLEDKVVRMAQACALRQNLNQALQENHDELEIRKVTQDNFKELLHVMKTGQAKQPPMA